MASKESAMQRILADAGISSPAILLG